jgi:competence protein ComEC
MSRPVPLRAPLLWLLLPFMAGIVAADACAARAELSVGLALVLGGAAVLGYSAWRKETAWSALGSGLSILLLAGAAGWLWLPLRAAAGAGWPHVPREVEVELAVDQVFPPAPHRKTFSGLARVTGAAGPARELAGQRVYFSAIRRVSHVPEISGRYRYRGVVENLPPARDAVGFDRYLENVGVRVRLGRGHFGAETRPPSAFRRFCARAQDRLQRILTLGLERHPELASVYAAMLLGEKALLAPEQETAFMRSGVFHIFSISGLHVGVIAIAILSGLKLLRVPPRLARLAGLAVLWLYVQITGGSTPAERAFLMIGFVVMAKVLRLPGNPLAALAGAALVTLWLDPRQLFSTGFQMSYSVVAAIVVLGAPLAERWRASWQPWRDLPEANWSFLQHGIRWSARGLLAALAVTWAATLASTPSSIGNFGLFSPGALIANLIVLPLSSLALMAGFVSLLGGLLWLEGISILMNHAAALVILVMDWLVREGTALPGVYFPADFLAPWMGAASLTAVLGAMLLAANQRLGRHAPLWLPPLVLLLTLILGVKFR